MKIDTETGATQKCFVGDDGYRRCNFVFRRQKATWTKSGKWWRFKALPFRKFLKRKLPEETIVSPGKIQKK